MLISLENSKSKTRKGSAKGQSFLINRKEG
jgi:hypothetical protein